MRLNAQRRLSKDASSFFQMENMDCHFHLNGSEYQYHLTNDVEKIDVPRTKQGLDCIGGIISKVIIGKK